MENKLLDLCIILLQMGKKKANKKSKQKNPHNYIIQHRKIPNQKCFGKAIRHKHIKFKKKKKIKANTTENQKQN